MFTISNGKVFHYDVEIKGARAETFVAFNNTWARDDKRVYYWNRVRRVRDLKSFEALNQCYARDQYQVYVPGVNFPKADPATFEVLDAGSSPHFTMPLTGIHRICGYAKDKNAVYFTNVAVRGADLETFQSLRSDYGIDARDAYYEGKPLHVKHVASWRPVSHTLSCDQHAVYFCNRLVVGADPNTVWRLLPVEDHYFRDRESFYCNDFPISSQKYYAYLEGRITHYTQMLSLFRKGDYFSTHFRRCVPPGTAISDNARDR